MSLLFIFIQDVTGIGEEKVMVHIILVQAVAMVRVAVPGIVVMYIKIILIVLFIMYLKENVNGNGLVNITANVMLLSVIYH